MATAHAALAEPRIRNKTLIRVQAWSGLVFATFLVLHLGNLVAALFGAGVYDAWMRTMRWYYQFPPIEIFAVVGSAGVHIGAGILRIVRRRRERQNERPPTLRVRLHRLSGYMMMAAFAGHVAATRLPSLYGTPVDHSLLGFSLTYAGVFFYPYYVLFAASGFYHLGNGAIGALRIVGARLPRGMTAPRSRLFWAWALAGALFALLGVLALGGAFHELDRTRFLEWQAYFDELVPAGWAPW